MTEVPRGWTLEVEGGESAERGGLVLKLTAAPHGPRQLQVPTLQERLNKLLHMGLSKRMPVFKI